VCVCVHTIIDNRVLFAGEIPGLRTQTQVRIATDERSHMHNRREDTTHLHEERTIAVSTT
jgi:hypothetical protein